VARPWAEYRKKMFSAARIKANDAEAERLLTLMELRNELDVTQVQLADALSITQSALSKLEHQADTKLSTLRNYVEKLGGSLVVKARFGDIEKELNIGA
jgi:DNA-binding XRE family transcriptional regulator